MSNINAKVVFDSAQAQASLDKLTQKLKTTNEGFAKLGTALSGIAVGAFVKSAFDMADAMSDVADATELTIASVMGFSKAVAASGGSTEGAQKSLLKFTESIATAAEGSASLQDAFFRVGVSLQDIQKLSSQDLLSKTLEGLGKVSDVSARLKLQSDLLGKGFKGVNVAGVNESYAGQTAASQAAANASIKAAVAVDKFNATIQTMKEQVLVALTPVIDAFNKLPVSQIANITKLLVELGLTFAVFKTGAMTLSLFSSSIAGVSSMFSKSGAGFNTYIRGAQEVNKLAAVSIVQFARTGNAGLGMANAFKLAGLTIAGMVNGMMGLFKGIFGLIGGFGLLVAQILLVNDAIAAITGFDFIDTWAKKLESFVKTSFPSLYSAIDKLGKKMGMADINGKPQDAALSDTAGTAESEKKLEANRLLVDALAKQRTEFAKILTDYKEANAEAFKRYNLETDMIGKSAEMQANMQMANEKEIAYLNTKKSIQEKIDTITKSGTESEKSGLLPGLLEEQKALTAEYEKQKAAISGLVAERMKADAADKLNVYTTNQKVLMNESLAKIDQARANIFLPEIKKQYNDIESAAKASAAAQIASEEARRGAPLSKDEISAYYAAALAGVKRLTTATAALNEEQNKWQLHLYGLQQEIDLSNNLNKIQDDMATMTMPEIEKKYYDIASAARDSAKAAIEAEEARRGAKLDPAEAQAYYDRASAGIGKLTAATKKQWEMSRSFETGWKKAMNSYINEATNAATKAEKLFTTAFKGMEDAIVGFAKTGKFEWKSFVSDMLEQLLRSQIQGVFANLMTSITGSMSNATASSQANGSADSGIMGMLGGLFGGSGSGSSSGGLGGGQGTPVYVTNWPGGAAGGLSSMLGGTGAAASSSGGGIMDTIAGWFGGGSLGEAQKMTSQMDFGYDQSSPVASSDSSWLGSVANSVGDIASSIGDWFGGFFATGGTIPAGKIGIVGERGPEFIGGPANITPMSAAGTGAGQSTTVNYNIYANDAKSFQQMVAADPAFIHAVVMQGSKGMAA